MTVFYDDTRGSLLISDWSNHRVRAVNASTGVITTLAGIGVAGFSGDGGPATSALLHGPQVGTVTLSGDLLIADRDNCRIRKIAVGTGVISTIAGDGVCRHTVDSGAATSVSLNLPNGVTIDPLGNVIVLDSFNHRVRRIDIGTGVMTTIAGNGEGVTNADSGPATSIGIGFPFHALADPDGNLLFSDPHNCRIRRLVVSTGVLSTIAGSGVCGFGGDGGPARQAQLRWPHGLAVDSAGDMYVAEMGNHRVRVISASTGVITTVAGDGEARFNGLSGPATSVSLHEPYGLTLDAAGNVLIADSLNHCNDSLHQKLHLQEIQQLLKPLL
jgi:DNA-binding beta-propeller fold protein YncE